MLELDKKLNLILNLTEGPDSRSTADKVNDSLNEMYKTVEKVVQGSKREQEILKELNREEERRNRLLERRAQLTSRGLSTSTLDSEGARSVAKTRSLGAELTNVRGQRATDKAQLQEQRRGWEANTKAYEREEERRAQSAIRAMKKQEKERDKFIRSAKGALDGLLSLAESAALAYASMMNIDDSNVKKWLQWFAAIKSVGQGISGVYQLYKSINQVVQFLTTLRKADTAATIANTVAVALNTKAEQANCAAKAACSGGGWAADIAKKGAWQKVKDIGGKALGGLRGAGGWMARAATASAPFLAAAGTFIGAAEGTSRLINLAQGGGGREGIFGAVGSTWNARTSAQESERKALDLARRTILRNQMVRSQVNSPDYIYSQAQAQRENRNFLADSMGRYASMYSDSGYGAEQRVRAQKAAAGAAALNAQELMTRGSSLAATPGGREKGHQMLAASYEEEMRSIEEVIKLKKEEQQIVMDAAKKQADSARQLLEFSRALKNVYSDIGGQFSAAKGEMTQGILSSSRGESRRGFAAAEKLAKDEKYQLTYREAQALEATGLANTEERKRAIQAARQREAMRRNPEAARMYGSEAGVQVGLGMMGLGVATAAPQVTAKDKTLETNFNVKQEIVVKLERSQASEIDELMKTMQPKFEELLKKRNQELLNALAAAMEESIRKEIDSMDSSQVQQQLEAQL